MPATKLPTGIGYNKTRRGWIRDEDVPQRTYGRDGEAQVRNRALVASAFPADPNFDIEKQYADYWNTAGAEAMERYGIEGYSGWVAFESKEDLEGAPVPDEGQNPSFSENRFMPNVTSPRFNEETGRLIGGNEPATWERPEAPLGWGTGQKETQTYRTEFTNAASNPERTSQQVRKTLGANLTREAINDTSREASRRGNST